MFRAFLVSRCYKKHQLNWHWFAVKCKWQATRISKFGFQVYYIFYIYIYTWNVCPLFWGSNHPKQGPLQPKQWSFGFQVYIYIYSIFHPQDFCSRCILALMLGSFILCLIRNLALGFPELTEKVYIVKVGHSFGSTPIKKLSSMGEFSTTQAMKKHIGLFVWVFFGDDILRSYMETTTSHE